LSREEDVFLRYWMYDKVHYQDGTRPAKRLQVAHRAPPADLAVLIAAGLPDLAEQQAAGICPPPAEPPVWPWTEDRLRNRVAEARAALSSSLSWV
jgi:hypothetical protein